MLLQRRCAGSPRTADRTRARASAHARVAPMYEMDATVRNSSVSVNRSSRAGLSRAAAALPLSHLSALGVLRPVRRTVARHGRPGEARGSALCAGAVRAGGRGGRGGGVPSRGRREPWHCANIRRRVRLRARVIVSMHRCMHAIARTQVHGCVHGSDLSVATNGPQGSRSGRSSLAVVSACRRF